MNQAQRTFLIKKIEEKVKVTVQVLEKSLPKAPNLSNYLFHAVMSGTVKIRSQEEILEVLKQMALVADKSDDWLGSTDRWSNSSGTKVTFKVSDILVIPDEYQQKLDAYHEEYRKIRKEINDINTSSESVVTRIQLASDKTLQRMIDEVDDMGNLSLIDTKLKLLSQ